MSDLTLRQAKLRAVVVDLNGFHFGKKISEELTGLVTSAGVGVSEVITAKCDYPSPETLVRKGKVSEIKNAVLNTNADLVIFNHELSAVQQRNLERITGRRVIDRSTLILDIFAQRAKSHEGKLQVELAQLQHLSSRLIRGWTHLERQKGGIGLRGPGESQLETDRRLIGRRIKLLKTRIVRIVRRRETQRKGRKRGKVARISLIGYTNAGKSTLFNKLTKQTTYAANQLFATLDTKTRRIYAGCNRTILLSDTVGFIKDLPHTLIASFRATLEEVADAELLLHVVDSGSEDRLVQMDSVNTVLRDIGAEHVRQLLVFNKTDLSSMDLGINRDPCGKIESVRVSAKTGAGLDDLRNCIRKLLLHPEKEVSTVDYSGQDLFFNHTHLEDCNGIK